MNICKGRSITVRRNELEQLKTPEPTHTWKPISHAHLVNTLYEQLEEKGLSVTKEDYSIYKDGLWLFGLMVINKTVTNEFSTALAFRHSNDKTMALRIVAGVNVFICDNMTLSGDEYILQRKHTNNFKLENELAIALDKYGEQADALIDGIIALKEQRITEEEAKAFMYDAVMTDVISAGMIKKVGIEYFDVWDNHENMWDLHNAFTSILGKLDARPQYTRTLKLGKMFHL